VIIHIQSDRAVKIVLILSVTGELRDVEGAEFRKPEGLESEKN